MFFVDCCFLVAMCCPLSVVYCSLFVGVLLVSGCVMCVVCYVSLFVVCCLWSAVCCVLPVVWYGLLSAVCKCVLFVCC